MQPDEIRESQKKIMQQQLKQLDQEGYTVFKGFLDRETTTRVREHMDSLMPPVVPLSENTSAKLQVLRHPIPGKIMAEILANPRLQEVARTIIGSNDLRLLEQVLIRTDGQKELRGAGGWHVDMAFRPEHYDAKPRQMYYHMVHALNTVPPGGGAFTILPGSHRQTFAAAAELKTDEEMKELETYYRSEQNLNYEGAIEVLAEEGDLIVFNPMTLHTASHNTTDQPRYVYFASFFDPSAEYLRNQLEARNYRGRYHEDLVNNLPEELQSLLAD